MSKIDLGVNDKDITNFSELRDEIRKLHPKETVEDSSLKQKLLSLGEKEIEDLSQIDGYGELTEPYIMKEDTDSKPKYNLDEIKNRPFGELQHDKGAIAYLNKNIQKCYNFNKD
jgi:hypothetical protein